MLKLIRIARCSLCTATSSQSPFLYQGCRQTSFSDLEQLRLHLKEGEKCDELPKGERAKIISKPRNEDPKAVMSILDKYKIDTSTMKKNAQILSESPFEVEKRIIFLQELNVPVITTNILTNFTKAMYMPVNILKAHLQIEPEVNLAKNLFSSIEINIDFSELENLDHNLIMKLYFSKCFVHFVKNELDLNEKEVKMISYRKSRPGLYNSFRLLQRLLTVLKNDLKFNKKLIIKEYWLFTQHPDYIMKIYYMLHEEWKEETHSILSKYPKLLDFDLKDLSQYISAFKEFGITPKMISNTHKIFHFDSNEFRKRVTCLCEDPYTLVYRKHPSFLLLVRFYYVVLSRIKYLREKNFKYATIYSLTTYNNTMERLLTIKKMNKTNIRCFFEAEFGKESKNLLIRFKKHPGFSYVPLLPMYESLMYLRQHFPEEAIRNQIFTILYHKTDLKTAHEILMQDEQYKNLPLQQLLAMCVYRIEIKTNFTGEAVLTPKKYTESMEEESEDEKL